MKTLYVRNVPEEVVERLEQLAAREATSVNAVVLRELAAASAYAGNAERFTEMADAGVDPALFLRALDDERAQR